jgi:hypothetical protein
MKRFYASITRYIFIRQEIQYIMLNALFRKYYVSRDKLGMRR